ncbi:MAG: U32 family peptidase C-terminal domain-containing protein, partial [Oscillospiraceae bacterium]|nr:U32 family peptidase C-terminal domain-containing protein [Oscillospiraceae bacterium]
VKDIRDEEGNPMGSAPHPKQKLFVSLSEEAQEYDILRRKA